MITKKISEARVSNAKKVAVGKKFIEDSSRSSSNSKAFG